MADTLGTWVLEGGHVYLGLLAIIICAGVHYANSSARDKDLAIELLLMYSMGIAGFKGIFSGFVTHFFFADQIAESIGWQPGSPFQTEVAFTNLALGVLGAATFWRKDFWLPFIVASTIMGWGAGLTHVHGILETGNNAANNAGPILYVDLLIPLVRLALYALYLRGSRSNEVELHTA
jgi:hypothetical protein